MYGGEGEGEEGEMKGKFSSTVHVLYMDGCDSYTLGWRIIYILFKLVNFPFLKSTNCKKQNLTVWIFQHYKSKKSNLHKTLNHINWYGR